MDPDHPCYHFDMGHVHMASSFHFGYCENVLFDTWKIRSVGSLVGSMFGIMGLAIIFEGLKAYRENLLWSTAGNSSNSKRSMILGIPHLGQTALHVVQMVLSYFLMLIVMYFNVWLFISVVVGATVGYFIFGWMKLRALQPECSDCGVEVEIEKF